MMALKYMDKKDIAREWFEIAGIDLATAEYLQKMIPTPIEIICYHCQQSAEKYLKGYLAFQGEEIKKTHDLVLLNKTCQIYDEDYKILEEDCLMLTDYGVNVRYPFPMDLNESDIKIAIKFASKIQKCQWLNCYIVKLLSHNNITI